MTNTNQSGNGSWLRDRRTRALLTQENLAELTGVDARTIRDIETGRTPKPRTSTTRLLLAALETAEGQPTTPQDPEPPQTRHPHELPPDTTGFVGRSHELSALDHILELTEQQRKNKPIIGISGTAGSGKTALATHWAHQVAERFPDGQLYLNLQGYDVQQPVQPDDALAAFLRSLGVAEPAIPSGRTDRTRLFRTLLADRTMLVLLDNAYDATQVRDLLPGASPSLVVITSRDMMAGLAVHYGLHRIVLDDLPTDDAIALLRIHVGGKIDTDPNAVTMLASQCAHLPLALRIAAQCAAIRSSLTLSELTAELVNERDRLDLLDVGDPYSSVRAVFSWSYQHLAGPAARLFRLWGVHPCNDLDRSAIEALTELGQPVAGRAVDALIRAHLLQEIRPGRYGMHDLLRLYARELADTTESDEAPNAALSRLLDYYTRTATEATDLLNPHEGYRLSRIPRTDNACSRFEDRPAAAAWLDAERANLIAIADHAADHGWPTYSVHMSNLLFRYLDTRGHHADAARVHSTALRVAASEDRGLVCSNYGAVLWRAGRYQEVFNYYTLALASHRETGDHWGEGSALGSLGAVHWRLGSYLEALTHFRRAFGLFQKVGDRRWANITTGHIGIMCWHMGRYQDAYRYLERAVKRLREMGDSYGESGVLEGLGLAASRLGRYDEAVRHQERSLALAREVGDRQGEVEMFNSMGLVFREAGSTHRALDNFHQGLASADDLKDPYEQGRAHEGIALCHLDLGDSAEARERWRAALTIHSALGTPEAKQIEARLQTLDYPK